MTGLYTFSPTQTHPHVPHNAIFTHLLYKLTHLNILSLQLYGRKGSWEDPADWVIDSYPWLPSSSQDWPSLLRLRPEDVGFDGYNVQTAGTKGSQSGAQSDVEGDPLVRAIFYPLLI